MIGLQDITAEFQFDGKLEHLRCAMKEVLDLVVASFATIETQNQKQAIIRLLQQTIECCLFIKKYSQKSFEGETQFPDT